MTITAPPLAESDRAKCTVTLTANPYENGERLIGALNICNVRKDHVVASRDDLAAVLAGKKDIPK